jgi:hypothetical protein
MTRITQLARDINKLGYNKLQYFFKKTFILIEIK